MTLHRLRLGALILSSSCVPATLLLEHEAGAVAIAGAAPWTIQREAVASTTVWTIYTAPGWARQCLVKNEDAAGDLNVGRYDETSTFSAATDEYIVVAAGAALTISLASSSAQPDADHLDIPLHSTTASLVVGIYCTASPQ